MTDHRKLDDPLAAPLAHALATGLDRSVRECPDAEALALYFDRALAADEAARWERHFSACARCQEQLAAMARMETAAVPAAPEAARRPSGVSWLWNWRWLAPAAAALGALAIWVVVQNVSPPTTSTETTIAKNDQREPLAVPPAKDLKQDEGTELTAATPGKRSAPAPEPASGSSRAFTGLTSKSGAKLADASGKDAPATRVLADRTDLAALPKAPATNVGALQAAPGVSQEKDKKETASEFALQVEPRKAREEAQRERQAQGVQISPAQQQAGLDQQVAAQAPAPPARANEQHAQAGRDAAQKSQVTPQTARDELKKTEPQAPGQAVVVEPSPVTMLRRQEGESGGRYRAANVAGTKVVWRLGPGGSIERSADGGTTWQRQSSGVTADLLAGSAPSATVCWAVGRGGVVLRTTDGNTWTQLGSPTSQDLIAIVAADADQATVTTIDGKRYATTDGGRTWRSL